MIKRWLKIGRDIQIECLHMLKSLIINYFLDRTNKKLESGPEPILIMFEDRLSNYI